MMNSLEKAETQGNVADNVLLYPKLEDLLGQVLASVGEELMPNSILQNYETKPEVILDIQIANFRYTLTRYFSPKTSPSQTNLSPREQEIVRLVAKGHPNKIIAAVLEISPWTVSTHLRRVFAKLGVSSRAEMVARVFDENMLSGSK